MSKPPIPKLFLVTYTEEYIRLWHLPAEDPAVVMKLPQDEQDHLVASSAEEVATFTLEQAEALRSTFDRTINLFKRQKFS